LALSDRQNRQKDAGKTIINNKPTMKINFRNLHPLLLVISLFLFSIAYIFMISRLAGIKDRKNLEIEKNFVEKSVFRGYVAGYIDGLNSKTNESREEAVQNGVRNASNYIILLKK
jgi:hypothetical protein